MLSYVNSTPDYNPYNKAKDDYDWHFENSNDKYKFTDSYRGFNPYSGIECVYANNSTKPFWISDYVGYVDLSCNIDSSKIYTFLKDARGNRLKNCNTDLFTNFDYVKDDLSYILKIQRIDNYVLEKVNILYNDNIVAQHIASGVIKNDKDK